MLDTTYQIYPHTKLEYLKAQPCRPVPRQPVAPEASPNMTLVCVRLAHDEMSQFEVVQHKIGYLRPVSYWKLESE